MEIQQVLVRIGACESYSESIECLSSGKVLVNGSRIDFPWYFLKGGYYAVKLKGVGLYRFNIRDGKLGKVKTKLKEVPNEQTGI
jgi:ribosomal protein S4